MSSLSIVIIGVLMGIINLAGSSIPDAYAPPATKGYSFSYDVKDPYTGQDFGHQEKLEDIVTGEYHVLLPDDRYQVVNYRADHNGYVADVKYGEGASSTYIKKGGSGNNKYNNEDHQQAAYGSNDSKYQSYGKQEDSKYNNEKIYGKQEDKYSQQTYGKQEDNKYAEPSMTYGKQEDKYADKNYGGNNNNYQNPSSTYGKTPTYPSSGSGAGYSAGGMDGADGYPSSGSGAGYSSGHLDGYGSQNTAGHHDMKQNYGGSYLAGFAAGIHNKQQQGSGGYGSYSGPNGCKCV